MQMAQYISNKTLNVWHLIPKFFVTKAGPALASSGTAITKLSNMMGSSSPAYDDKDATTAPEQNRARMEWDYSLYSTVQKELETPDMRLLSTKDTVGANSETLQCLRKGPVITSGTDHDSLGWGVGTWFSGRDG